jgi:hypothetical protein
MRRLASEFRGVVGVKHVQTLLLIGTLLGACTTVEPVPASDRRIYGPADYTVFWDLPERDFYWVPKGTEWSEIFEAAGGCGAELETGLSWHNPLPPNSKTRTSGSKAALLLQIRLA